MLTSKIHRSTVMLADLLAYGQLDELPKTSPTRGDLRHLDDPTLVR